MSRHRSALSSGTPCDALPSQKELAQLARDDPQAFEALRAELIENAIQRAPERLQLRLRQLQFRIDGIRRLARTPLGALLKMQALMWDSFLRMNEALQQFDALSRAATRRHDGHDDGKPHDALVIDFRTRLPLGG
jgi:hypothetical protein